MNHLKYHSIAILFFLFLPVVAVGAFNYLVDPLQVYRKRSGEAALFWRNQRYQNAGIIRNFFGKEGYDSIILGNSVVDNFIPSHVSRAFRWGRTLKLTVNGGHISEQSFMLQQVEHSIHLKNVFWGHRAANLMIGAEDKWHPEQTIPFYLYSKTPFDDKPYLLSLDITRFSKNLITGNLNLKRWSASLDRLNYWMTTRRAEAYAYYDKTEEYKKFEKRAKETHYKPLGHVTYHEEEFPAALKHVISPVQHHPHVNFIFLFTPQNRLSLKVMSPGRLRNYYAVQKFLVDNVSGFSNVSIFGFEDVDQVVANLANYRDSIHYHSGVNEWMLKEMSEGRHRLTRENMDAYILRATSPLADYEPFFDYETMIPIWGEDQQKAFLRALEKKRSGDLK